MIRKTFKDVRISCEKYGLELLSIEPDNKLVYKVSDPNYWKIKCKCTKIFSTMLCSIYTENTKSCGCRDIEIATIRCVSRTKYTYGDVRKIIKSNNLELLSNEPDDKPIQNVTNKKVNVRCWCINQTIFQTYLHKLYSGNTKSCGCLKTNHDYVKSNIEKKTKYLFKDVINACDKTGLLFLHDIDPNKKIFDTKPGNWNVKCFCGKVYQPDIGDLIYSKTRSCGCIKSQPQNEIEDYIKSLEVKNVKSDDNSILKYKDKEDNERYLQLDINCGDIVIEYSGLWWHSESHLDKSMKERKTGITGKNYHRFKMELCEAQNKRLITIFEPEWLTKQSIVKSYLRAILGLKTVVIGARKCVVKKVSRLQCHAFCNEYHIQGRTHRGGVAYGLFYKDELIACAFYGDKSGRGDILGNGVWDLARYCVKGDISIPGGLSKIQKQFINDHKPKKIISFSDNRWSQGKIYKTLGFKLVEENKPDYQYFKKGTQGPLLNKSFGMKNKIKKRNPEIYDAQKSERQMMEQTGYERIYDCGKKRWELILACHYTNLQPLWAGENMSKGDKV